MFGIYHWIALALFAGFAAVDLATRARRFPDVRLWRLKGAAFLAAYFILATYAPLFWDGWLGEHRLVDATALPLWAQIAGGFLLLELGVYAWHRTMHNVGFLWRWFHQMHHSAERVDIWGAFYFHPLDMLVGSLALVLGFGVGAEAAIAANLLATFCSMFQHANIRTPRWLGYVVTRPESHSAHHERGVHGRNYGDIPLWDMLFGTFHNPATFEGEVGFYEGASKKLAPMLIGKVIA
jgi:sterol desaturase/sphingolipid hydroxylase (fatty acid hydroxylase superfamily)